MTQEQKETIRKAVDIARAAQDANEEAVRNLEDAIEDATDLTWVNLRGVDLGEPDEESIVKLARKLAKEEMDEFMKL
jgi:hypothetical protein